MGYSIIFETKIVKLSDGRIIHFDRSGCNNDDAGRTKGEFTGKLYNIDDFIKRAEGFKKDSKPIKESNGWDLKINSRRATYFDYGEHLLRMLKRAENYQDFVLNRYVSAKYCVGMEILKPEYKVVNREEFQAFMRSLPVNSSLTYRRMMEYPEVTKEQEIIKALEANEYIEFYIGKTHK